MTNEVKRSCTRVTDCGKKAWSINLETAVDRFASIAKPHEINV
ncbi:MAG: hypothetical protein WA129_04555 [Acidovorax sp.]